MFNNLEKFQSFCGGNWQVCRNKLLPRNAKERVDDDANCNNEKIKMVATPLLQKVLLPVYNHCRDLLVLVCKTIFTHLDIIVVIIVIKMIIP